jgi:hypothetical protein
MIPLFGPKQFISCFGLRTVLYHAQWCRHAQVCDGRNNYAAYERIAKLPLRRSTTEKRRILDVQLKWNNL